MLNIDTRSGFLTQPRPFNTPAPTIYVVAPRPASF